MTSGTMEYRHVQQWQKDVLSEFGDIISTGTTTGDALDILNEYQDTDNSADMKSNDPDRWACGMSVASQVQLLSEMQKKGLITSKTTGQHSTSS